ncbi:unnamed protein product [Nezara viridula]|uniref:Uncharacterized protein n=1 Tax=Nezara viridula TaxID=85310 RepID=A0A9P0E6Y2_NEZVI|nr:unnamed protein product [Nezara viridula]
MFITALRDMMVAIPTKHVAFITDDHTDGYQLHQISKVFFESGIMLAYFTLEPNPHETSSNDLVRFFFFLQIYGS